MDAASARQFRSALLAEEKIEFRLYLLVKGSIIKSSRLGHFRASDRLFCWIERYLAIEIGRGTADRILGKNSSFFQSPLA